MNTHFESFAAARAAGFRNRTFLGAYGWNRDISGGRSFGYQFELYLQDPLTDETSDVPIGQTVTVWSDTNPNRIGQPGCFAAMYPPAVVALAESAARDMRARDQAREVARSARHAAKRSARLMRKAAVS